MAVIKMNKISVLGLQSERARLLETLMAMGVVEVTDSGIEEDDDPGIIKPQTGAELTGLDNMISVITSALEANKRYNVYKKPMFSSRRVIGKDEFQSILEAKDGILDTVHRINACESEIVRQKGEENRQRSILASLDVWMDVDFSLDVNNTRTTTVYLGTLPYTVDLDEFEKTIDEQIKEATLIRSGSDREHHYILLVVHKTKEQEALALLKSKGFNPISFRDMQGTPGENRKRILDLIAEISKEREVNIGKIKEMSSEREKIEVLYDAVKMERGRISTAGKLLTTHSVFFLKGWLPAEVSEKLKKTLEKNFLCSVQIAVPEKGEETPVLIENGPVSEAIQPVINMYGVPSSLEVDPSAITMVFFVIFFGMIISDAGYGLILAIASGIAIKLFKMEAGTRRFLKLVFFSGLTTIFWGIMFGGLFGIETISKYAVWFNPSAPGGTEKLMVFCLLFGVIHLYVGHTMKAINLFRRKQYLDIVMDVLFPVIMYTGFAMTILPNVPGLDPEMAKSVSSAGTTVLLVGVILTVITAGRKNRSIIGKILGGLPKLYDIIGFLGDVLSYMRLLALSLSGAILAGLVNGMAGGGGIVFKLTGGLLILALGHAINFGMGILGAFVHSCRLQYLEFFSKFLEGGGETFRPFKANTQYIMVKQEDESI